MISFQQSAFSGQHAAVTGHGAGLDRFGLIAESW